MALGVVEPPPPDVGDIAHFKSCKTQPMRLLSERDRCQIAKLSARCLPADDCIVQCLSSRDGIKVGGGCEHVCFASGRERPPPPPGWSDCGH